MRLFKLFTTASLLGMALPEPSWAQVQPADRVRILTVNGATLTGVVTEASGDSIALSAVVGQGAPHWVRNPEIALLERSAGRYRQFARNLALTTLSGAALGGMAGALTWTKCVSNEFLGCLFHPESRSDAFWFGSVVAGAFSVPVGILLGLAIQYDRWEPVQKSGATGSSFSVMPRLDRGVGVSASFSF